MWDTVKLTSMPDKRMKLCIIRKVNCFLKMQEKSYPNSCPISTLFAADSRVSPFQSQEPEKDLTTFVERCFSRLQGLLPLKDLSFCSLRTSKDFLVREVVMGNFKNRIGYKGSHRNFINNVFDVTIIISPVSKFLKSKSAYRAKEAKENTFFEDIQLVSKAVKNNSCQTVIPTTKRDC